MPSRTEGELRIEITEAGDEVIHFRALLKRTLPLLRDPASVSEMERIALLEDARNALEEGYDAEDSQDCSGEPWP